MRKYFLFLYFVIFTATSWARECSLEEIRTLDIQKVGSDYSSYPMMTRAALLAPLIPIATRLDSANAENDTFWAINFAGIAGAIYFGVRSFDGPDCSDPRGSDGSAYNVSLAEVVRYHHKQRDFFWKTYAWIGAWMAGIVLTTNYPERQMAAVGAAALPWAFAFSGRWSAFSEDNELQMSLRPLWNGRELVYLPTVQWVF